MRKRLRFDFFAWMVQFPHGFINCDLHRRQIILAIFSNLYMAATSVIKKSVTETTTAGISTIISCVKIFCNPCIRASIKK